MARRPIAAAAPPPAVVALIALGAAPALVHLTFGALRGRDPVAAAILYEEISYLLAIAPCRTPPRLVTGLLGCTLSLLPRGSSVWCSIAVFRENNEPQRAGSGAADRRPRRVACGGPDATSQFPSWEWSGVGSSGTLQFRMGSAPVPVCRQAGTGASSRRPRRLASQFPS